MTMWPSTPAQPLSVTTGAERSHGPRLVRHLSSEHHGRLLQGTTCSAPGQSLTEAPGAETPQWPRSRPLSRSGWPQQPPWKAWAWPLLNGSWRPSQGNSWQQAPCHSSEWLMSACMACLKLSLLTEPSACPWQQPQRPGPSAGELHLITSDCTDTASSLRRPCSKPSPGCEPSLPRSTSQLGLWCVSQCPTLSSLADSAF